MGVVSLPSPWRQQAQLELILQHRWLPVQPADFFSLSFLEEGFQWIEQLQQNVLYPSP